MASQDDVLAPETLQEAALAAAGRTVSLFAGYDCVGGEPRSPAVTGSEISGGATSSVNVSVCEGLVELSEALRIDQSLSVDFAGVAKVDQKMEFVKKQKATEQTLSIVVYARHESGSTTARDTKLSVEPTRPGIAAFVAAHGDSYVDSVVHGGEYYGVYTFRTQTNEQQESLKASLKANGIYSGVSASVTLGVEIDKFAKATHTAWTFDQSVSGIANPELPTREQLVDYAIGFPKLPLDRPVVVAFTTSGYEHVPGFDARELGFTPVVTNRRYFVGAGVDGGLTKSLVQIASLENTTNWLKGIYACYRYAGDTALDGFAAQLLADRHAVSAQFIAYDDDPLQAFAQPELPSLKQGMPVLNFEKGTAGPWGGSDGGPFDYGNIEEALQSQRRLVELRLRSGQYVDGLTFTYHDMHGRGQPEVHGGGGGGDHNPLSLDSNEFVTSVKVRSGTWVDWMRVATSSGASIEGGGGGGGEHSFELPDGAVVLGFQGRSGVQIDAIQVVWAKLKPAQFKK